MYNLFVDGLPLATKVSSYCMETVPKDKWGIELVSMSPARYKFRFDDSDTHLLMAIKFS